MNKDANTSTHAALRARGGTSAGALSAGRTYRQG